MCKSDSGADTRDSENPFPASLADERKREGGEAFGDRKKKKKSKERNEESGQGSKEEMGKETLFCPLSL